MDWSGDWTQRGRVCSVLFPLYAAGGRKDPDVLGLDSVPTSIL
jgi:hypothetical protein